MSFIKDIQHHTIISQPGIRFYFPDICKTGDLYLISFRESPDRRYARHIDPSSFPVLMAGKDPLNLDPANRRIIPSLPGGGTYPCLTRLNNGKTVLTDMRWDASPHSGGEMQQFHDLGWPVKFAGSHIIPVEFHGENPVPGPPGKISIPEYPEIGVTGSMIHIRGEEYLLAADIDDACYDKPMYNNSTILLHTPDSGQTWAQYSVITSEKQRPKPIFLVEPCVKLLKDGRMLCLMRSMDEHKTDFIYKTESADLGLTWRPPKPLRITGHPPFILELPDGRILALYGKRFTPVKGIAACLSEDGGRTWPAKNETMLRSDGENTDLGYPRAVVMDDGSILCVYYMTNEHPMPGEKRPPREVDCPTCGDRTTLHFCDTYMVRSICATRFFIS